MRDLQSAFHYEEAEAVDLSDLLGNDVVKARRSADTPNLTGGVLSLHSFLKFRQLLPWLVVELKCVGILWCNLECSK